MVYILGGPITLGARVRDTAGALTNATTISLAIKQPDGTFVSPAPTVTNPPAQTGLYSYVFTPVQQGLHEAKWTTTGPATQPLVDSFDVAESYPPMIVGLAEAKAFLNIEDDDQDDELRAMIEGVTAVVENEVGPVVRRQVTTTLYPTSYSSTLPLPHTQVLTIDSAAYVSDAATIPVTGWNVDGGVVWLNSGAVFPSYPFTLTYTVGRPDLPANIRMAALEILRLAWDSQRGSEPPPFLISFRAQAWLAPDQEVLGFA